MDEHNRAVIERYWPPFDARDGDTMRELAHDDLVTEWPQSGEQILGKRAAFATPAHFLAKG